MGKRIKQIVVILVAILVVCSVSIAHARDFSKGDSSRQKPDQVRKEIVTRLVEELDLTTVQKEQLTEHFQAQKAEGAKLRKALQANRKEIKDVLDDYNSKRGKISKIVAEIKKVEAKLIDKRVEGILAIREILTEDQFNELHEKLAARQKSMKRRSNNDQEEDRNRQERRPRHKN